MPSIDDLVTIGVEKLSNPAYIAFLAMIIMQFLGKGIISAIHEAATGRLVKDWPAKNVVTNAVTFVLTLGFAFFFAVPGQPRGAELLRGIAAFALAVSEYEVVKNVIGAFKSARR